MHYYNIFLEDNWKFNFYTACLVFISTFIYQYITCSKKKRRKTLEYFIIFEIIVNK